MLDTILDYLLDKSPIIAVGFIAVYVTYFLTRKGVLLHTRVNKVEEECVKIENQIAPKLNSIEKSINGLVVYLTSKDKNLDSKLFVSNSPMKLTPLGESILKEYYGNVVIDNNFDEFKKVLDRLPINSALDVETHAPFVIFSKFDEEILKPVKDKLYLHPVYRSEEAPFPLSPTIMCDIMGYYLRDMYLSKVRPDLIDSEESKSTSN